MINKLSEDLKARTDLIYFSKLDELQNDIDALKHKKKEKAHAANLCLGQIDIWLKSSLSAVYTTQPFVSLESHHFTFNSMRLLAKKAGQYDESIKKEVDFSKMMNLAIFKRTLTAFEGLLPYRHLLDKQKLESTIDEFKALALNTLLFSQAVSRSETLFKKLLVDYQLNASAIQQQIEDRFLELKSSRQGGDVEETVMNAFPEDEGGNAEFYKLLSKNDELFRLSTSLCFLTSSYHKEVLTMMDSGTILRSTLSSKNGYAALACDQKSRESFKNTFSLKRKEGEDLIAYTQTGNGLMHLKKFDPTKNGWFPFGSVNPKEFPLPQRGDIHNIFYEGKSELCIPSFSQQFPLKPPLRQSSQGTPEKRVLHPEISTGIPEKRVATPRNPLPIPLGKILQRELLSFSQQSLSIRLLDVESKNKREISCPNGTFPPINQRRVHLSSFLVQNTDELQLWVFSGLAAASRHKKELTYTVRELEVMSYDFKAQKWQRFVVPGEKMFWLWQRRKVGKRGNFDPTPYMRTQFSAHVVMEAGKRKCYLFSKMGSNVLKIHEIDIENNKLVQRTQVGNTVGMPSVFALKASGKEALVMAAQSRGSVRLQLFDTVNNKLHPLEELKFGGNLVGKNPIQTTGDRRQLIVQTYANSNNKQQITLHLFSMQMRKWMQDVSQFEFERDKGPGRGQLVNLNTFGSNKHTVASVTFPHRRGALVSIHSSPIKPNFNILSTVENSLDSLNKMEGFSSSFQVTSLTSWHQGIDESLALFKKGGGEKENVQVKKYVSQLVEQSGNLSRALNRLKVQKKDQGLFKMKKDILGKQQIALKQLKGTLQDRPALKQIVREMLLIEFFIQSCVNGFQVRSDLYKEIIRVLDLKSL